MHEWTGTFDNADRSESIIELIRADCARRTEFKKFSSDLVINFNLVSREFLGGGRRQNDAMTKPPRPQQLGCKVPRGETR